MNIKLMPVGYLAANCCVADDGNGVCAVIDPGDGAKEILNYIEKAGLRCERILLTHGHFDHIGALAEVKNATGAKVCIAAPDAGSLPVDADILVKDGDVVTAGALKFFVVQTPGHTEGSVCYICGDTMFSGDTLFAGDVGRTDLPGGSFTQMRQSLKKLNELPYADLAVIPGHEEATTLAHERETNRYMKAAR